MYRTEQIMKTLNRPESFETQQLESMYQQARGQFHNWSHFSLFSAKLGLLLSGAWIAATFLGLSAANLSLSIPPAIVDVISGLSFIQMRSARKQLDAIRSEVTEMRRLDTALFAVSTITDAKLRDESLATLAFQIPHRVDRSANKRD